MLELNLKKEVDLTGVFEKTATMERLYSALENFSFLYKESGNLEIFLKLADCHREICLIQNLPDDENFMLKRHDLLEQHGLL
jgi:hypothetical protein